MNIPIFAQQDPKWRDKKLSPSNLEMGGYGCYLTSLTMAMHNFSIKLNPGEVLDKLIAANGLNSDGLLTYQGVMTAFKDLYFHERVYTTNDPSSNGMEMQIDVAMEKVVRLLDLGQPTILCVDNVLHDGIPDHAVVAVDYEFGRNGVFLDYKIHNPDMGKVQWFSERYGDPKKFLYGYVAIIGAPIAYLDQSRFQGFGTALWKAAMVKKGVNVATYSKEIIENML